MDTDWPAQLENFILKLESIRNPKVIKLWLNYSQRLRQVEQISFSLSIRLINQFDIIVSISWICDEYHAFIGIIGFTELSTVR